jgi:polyferredoxin
MDYLVQILVPIACGCVVPIMIIWFIIRAKMNETNQRSQIVLAAIEKNPEMDIEELMKKISPKTRLLKEKLLTKLLWGSLSTMLGIGMIVYHFYMSSTTTSPLGLIGMILLPIGIAFLISYFFGKKMLAKEIEAEEQQLTAQANSK